MTRDKNKYRCICNKETEIKKTGLKDIVGNLDWQKDRKR